LNVIILFVNSIKWNLSIGLPFTDNGESKDNNGKCGTKKRKKDLIISRAYFKLVLWLEDNFIFRIILSLFGNCLKSN